MTKICFPRTAIVRSAHKALLLCAFTFTLIFATATVTQAQSSSGRPVARLITAQGPAIMRVPSRPRMVMPAASSASSSRGAASNVAAGVSSLERRAFELTNAQRIANGESPLVWDAELSRMARMHSQEMARTGLFDHVGPDGRDMRARAHGSNVRGWSVMAENIAYNQGFDDPAAFAVQRWMRSVKHRDNILNANFTRSAVGIARSADGRVFLTQLFIAR
jgi:uncharacterized protein YkwD